jgi:hypothetical protein
MIRRQSFVEMSHFQRKRRDVHDAAIYNSDLVSEIRPESGTSYRRRPAHLFRFCRRCVSQSPPNTAIDYAGLKILQSLDLRIWESTLLISQIKPTNGSPIACRR